MAKGTFVIVGELDYDTALLCAEDIKEVIGQFRDDVAFKTLALPSSFDVGAVSAFVLPISIKKLEALVQALKDKIK